MTNKPDNYTKVASDKASGNKSGELELKPCPHPNCISSMPRWVRDQDFDSGSPYTKIQCECCQTMIICGNHEIAFQLWNTRQQSDVGIPITDSNQGGDTRNKLYKLHAELVDKQFQSGLSSEEELQLNNIRKDLDISEAYERIETTYKENEGLKKRVYLAEMQAFDSDSAVGAVSLDIKRLKAELDKYKWIPVEERLPEMLIQYLVWGNEDVEVLNKVHWDDSITHWMPLPNPPQEQGKEEK